MKVICALCKPNHHQCKRNRWQAQGFNGQFAMSSVRLQPRLFPATFSAYCPHSHFQFIQVHQCVLACA